MNIFHIYIFVTLWRDDLDGCMYFLYLYFWTFWSITSNSATSSRKKDESPIYTLFFRVWAVVVLLYYSLLVNMVWWSLGTHLPHYIPTSVTISLPLSSTFRFLLVLFSPSLHNNKATLEGRDDDVVLCILK